MFACSEFDFNILLNVMIVKLLMLHENILIDFGLFLYLRYRRLQSPTS